MDWNTALLKLHAVTKLNMYYRPTERKPRNSIRKDIDV